MDLFKVLGTIAVENAEANSALDETADKARETSEKFDAADTSARNLSNGGFTILKGVASNLVTQGFNRLCDAVGQFISDGASYQMQMEQYTTSFETMTGSQEKAAEMTERLGEIAANTPFEMTTLADTTQLLMNYGFVADDAMDSMMMLGDIAQGDADKMGRIAAAYGQMSSAGKVSLEDIKQMIEAGFNPLQEISESTGESMESLYGRISNGTISVDEITASMQRSTEEGGKYFGAMDAQSETLNGRLSTLQDTANESIGNILGGLFQKAADEWIPALTEKVEKMDEKFTQFTDWIKEHQGLIEGLGIVIGVITTALGLQAVVQGVKAAMNAAEATSLGALITMKLADAAATLVALAPYLLIAAAIAGLIAVIVLCVKHWDEIKAKVQEVAAKIGEWVSNAVETVKAKIAEMKENLSAKFEEIKNNISEKFTAAKETVLSIFDNIKSGIEEKINNAKEKVGEAIEKIKGFFDFEWKLPEIKLPHFSITGTNSLGLPKIAVEWYAEGGIMKKPTVFGVNPATGSAMVGGEAGPEAVAPISVLQGYVAEAVASQNAAQNEGLLEAMRELIAVNERANDEIADLKDAIASMRLEINHREFGRLVKGVT